MEKNRLSFFLNTNLGRKTVLVLFDAMCFAAISTAFYMLSLVSSTIFGASDPDVYVINSVIQLVLVFVFRFVFRVYRNVWRYPNVESYMRIVVSDTLAAMLALAFSSALGVYSGLGRAATIGAFNLLIALISRFVYSILHKYRQKHRSAQSDRTPVALVGAGRLGSYLAEDLLGNPSSKYRPMFFVDSDPSKVGNTVSGLIVYPREKASELIKSSGIKDVFVTIANQEKRNISEIYYYYKGLGCHVRIYDSLVTGDSVQRGVLREFSIEDLLFRDSIKINDRQVAEYYGGKTVLITGGGGSIGSEICRQIAKCSPKKLVIFDIYENNAYDIQQELIRKYGQSLDLAVEIGSVRDAVRLEDVFAHYRPDVVFHAAAHKHVPLMEGSGGEAIKNNVMGTYNAANMAEKYGVKKFILISTDKAVNPTNIMGASKRMCEMVVQCRGDSNTSFAAVRFGNVLGSNGSVIPLFKRQIAEGGPVTITDKRIQRYFMTIPEASQLVIQAGAMAHRGELFVLNMGTPVMIYDLAEQMIRLSGFEPGIDIEIKEVGLRPGEKLFEELLLKTEKLDKTENDMIFIERDAPFTRAEIEEKLRILNSAVEEWNGFDADIIRNAMAKVVPTYRDPEIVNKEALEKGVLEEQKIGGGSVYLT